MAILVRIHDIRAHLVREIEVATSQVKNSETEKEKRFHRGRVSGLKDALESVDLAQRGDHEDGPVGMRRAEEIMEEVKPGCTG